MQYALGIYALLEYVPVYLGSAHQANALNLFTAVLFTMHALRPAQKGPVGLAMARYGAPAAALLVGAIGLAVTTQH
jgi:cytochrome c oxidase assembly protein subunit 15